MIGYEQYKKISDYLLAQGQQELAGHLDGLWQVYEADHPDEARQNMEQVQEEASAEPVSENPPTAE